MWDISFEASINALEGSAKIYINNGVHLYDVDATGHPTSENLHYIRISAETSSNWVAGDYLYNITVSSADDIIEIQRGNVQILPNMAILQDLRTVDEKILDNINAVLTGTATFDQQRYKIQNRELDRIPRAELLRMKIDLEKRIAYAKRKERGMTGGILQIPIRFGVH